MGHSIEMRRQFIQVAAHEIYLFKLKMICLVKHVSQSHGDVHCRPAVAAVISFVHHVKLLAYTNRPNPSETSQAIAIAIQLVRVANRLLIAQLSTVTVNYWGLSGRCPKSLHLV